MNRKELKYLIDSLPLSDDKKGFLLENSKIYYEYLDFLSDKNPDIDKDVIEKTWDIKYKIMFEKKLKTLDVSNMSDVDILTVSLDLMCEIVKSDNFEKYEELIEKTEILLKLLR